MPGLKESLLLPVKSTTAALIVAGAVVIIGIASFEFSDLLRISAPAQNTVNFNGTLKTDSLTPGSHTIKITAQTQSGSQTSTTVPFTVNAPTATPSVTPTSSTTPTPTTSVTPTPSASVTPTPTDTPTPSGSATPTPTITVTPTPTAGVPFPTPAPLGMTTPTPTPAVVTVVTSTATPSEQSSSSDGGGGSSESSESESEPTTTVKVPGTKVGTESALSVQIIGETIKKVATQGVTLSGQTAYSYTNFLDGKHKVTVLAHPNVLAKYTVKVTQQNYLFELTAKNDAPGPVNIQIFINGKAWKIVTFSKGNNSYEKKAVGILRNLSSATISIKFLNDSWTCTAAQINANQTSTCDRNLFLESYSLTPVK